MRSTPPLWRRPEPLPGSLETPRLLVRWYQDGDAEALHVAVHSQREKYLPWLPWAAVAHATVDDSLATIRSFEHGRTKLIAPDFVLGTFDRSTGELVGGTGLHRIAPEVAEAEIGYWIRPERRGEGLCTEATAGLISAAFGVWGFRRIRIHCAGSNLASQRVPEKLGMVLEGRERKSRWVDGIGYDDHLTYGVLASEWDAETGRVHSPT